jgi:hypothetical protein
MSISISIIDHPLHSCVVHKVYVRPHCDEMRITKAVESSAAKPRDGVSLHIRVPIARVTLYLCETKRRGVSVGIRSQDTEHTHTHIYMYIDNNLCKYVPDILYT